jgi:hypothetical protein
MTTVDQVADELALRAVAARYAAGLDRRDAELFATAFLPDAELAFYLDARSTEPDTVRRGHASLREVPQRLVVYAETFHFLGQSLYELDGEQTTGVVHCLAHHRSGDDDSGTDYVMHMTYDDVYGRDVDGSWRIARRTGRVHWTETRPTNLPGT